MKNQLVSGKQYYATIANGIRKQIGKQIFRKFDLDWFEMRQGFEDLLIEYPKSFYILNSYAWFACQARDREKAKDLIYQIGDSWDGIKGDIWGTREEFKSWSDWAVLGKRKGFYSNIHHSASIGDYKKIIKSYSKNKFIIDFQDDEKKTPLHYAIEGGETTTAVLLIHLGANITLRNKYEEMPLHTAARMGNEELVRQLLMNGAPNVKHNYAYPLLIAARNGHENIVSQLLRLEDYIINYTVSGGYTALHFAAENGHQYVIERLINHDILIIDAVTNSGNSALHLAASAGMEEASAMLLYAGLDRTIKNSDGKTARELAMRNGHSEIVKMINEIESFEENE